LLSSGVLAVPFGQHLSSAAQMSELPDPGFFEGTEKHIEADFWSENESADLRNIPDDSWREVVKMCGTLVLNKKATTCFTSFLLSESSLIVYPRKIIIKTCGQTVPLRGMSLVYELASNVGLKCESVWYSRRLYQVPEKQLQEHQTTEGELAMCRSTLGPGEAYVLGPLTGVHWLLYDAVFTPYDSKVRGDFTVDIMMYDLAPDVCKRFFTEEPEGSATGAASMTKESGLAQLATSIGAEIDDYCFSPCGYSCNMHAGEYYCMVHVTPQEHCSYASFETNLGCSLEDMPPKESCEERLNNIITNVLEAFKPAKLTATLFTDSGALKALGNAPFTCIERSYKNKCLTSAHLEQDYVATVAEYLANTNIPGSTA